MNNYHNFEQILSQVGSLGRYQWFIYALMQYSNLLQTLNQNFMAFGKIEPPWTCDEGYDRENTTGEGTNISIPRSLSCPNFTTCKLVEEKSEFYSQVQAWSLYCDLSYVPMFIVSLQMLGIIPGAFVFNHVIDNYGRKWSCHFLNTAVLVLGIGSAFVDDWRVFATIRFLIGFLFGGLFTVTVVIQMEIIDERDRMWIYALDCWSVSNGILALIAYLTRDWKMLIIVSNCICIPLLLLSFLVKESPRWLMQKKKYHEAIVVLNHIARWNGKNVVIKIEELEVLVQYRRRQSLLVAGSKGTENGKGRQYSFLDIFHTRRSTINFLTLCYGWLTTACISYGLIYQNTAYTGSPFVNFAVAAAFRVFTQVIIFIADRYLKSPRRVLYLTSLGLVVAMLTVMTIVTTAADPENDHAAAMALRIVGLVCSGSMSALWLIIYILPIEIFPTVIRNIALGGCSIMARVGAVLGPQLLYLQKFWSPTPFVGFAIVAVINFIAAFITLPETRGTSLPDALEDDATLERKGRIEEAMQREPIMEMLQARE